jgi:hypothetical protein
VRLSRRCPYYVEVAVVEDEDRRSSGSPARSRASDAAAAQANAVLPIRAFVSIRERLDRVVELRHPAGRSISASVASGAATARLSRIVALNRWTC